MASIERIGKAAELPFGARGAFSQVFSGEEEGDYFVLSLIPFRKGADAESSLKGELAAEPAESVEIIAVPDADFAALKTDEMENSSVVLRRGRVVSILGTTDRNLQRPQLLALATSVSERLAGFPRLPPSGELAIRPRVDTTGFPSIELTAPGDHCYVHELWLVTLELGEDDGDGWLRGAGEIALGVTVREQRGLDGCSLAGEVASEPEVATFVRKDIELHAHGRHAFSQARLFSHLSPEHPHPESVIAVIVKERDDRGVLEWLKEILFWASTVESVRSGDRQGQLVSATQPTRLSRWRKHGSEAGRRLVN